MNRKTAIVSGALFILATVASLVGSSFTGPILDAPGYLDRVSSNWNGIVAGALFGLAAAVLSASIAISLYPLLKRYSEGLALGAVGFRLVESVFYIVAVICLVLLFPVSRQFVNAQGQAASYFQTLANLLLDARNLANFVFAVIPFSLGALMYYSIFFRTALVPRWLSGWGILAAVLLLSASLMTLFDGEPFSISGNLLILVLPIALQEMVFAVWLILKGFTASAVQAEIAGSRRAESRS